VLDSFLLYYEKFCIKKFSLEHNAEVISIAVGNNSEIVATGELAELPALHL